MIKSIFLTLFQVATDEAKKLDEFFERNQYVQGSYSEESAFEKLNEVMLKTEGNLKGNRIFYLALPPSVFMPVTDNLKKICMSKT